ncbi:MAG TPA: hypothetical protein VFK79_02330 [Xanthobacteraceae bacterium]|nr:hypothetical protein [Xanthobacteraceae bacterium]
MGDNEYFLRRANEELAAVDRATSAEAARALRACQPLSGND